MSDVPQDIIPPPRPRPATMIKGLVPRLPERGHIKIGELGDERNSRGGGKYQLPQKLDHFRITTLDRGTNNNFVIDSALYERLGLEPEPTELPVRLLYDDIGLNFPTRYACYAGKTLWCSGDGETAYRVSQVYGQPPLPEPFPVTCPCHRSQAAYDGKDKCKLNGRLSVLIDGAGGVGGVWVFRTTSFNSVNGILSSLTFLRSVTGGILANIPLRLRVTKKQAQRPTDQQPVTIYIVSLEYAGDITELQQEAHQIALDRARTHLSIENIEQEARRSLALLPSSIDAALPGDEPEDIVAEFYPEQADEEMMAGERPPPPPRPTRADFGQGIEQAAGAARIKAQQAALLDARYGDRVLKTAPEDISQERVEVYPVVTEDGETEQVPLDRLVSRLGDVFIASARRGRKAWIGSSESNDLVDLLRDEGHGDVADEVIKMWQAAEPKEPRRPATATRPSTQAASTATDGTPPATTSGSRAQTGAASQSSTAGNGPTATTGASRSELWQRNSYKLAVPKDDDGQFNFAGLRDKLAQYVAEVETVQELSKLCRDNMPNIDLLKQNFPAYEAGVQALVDSVNRRLKGEPIDDVIPR